MKFLAGIVRLVDGLNDKIGYLVSWLTTLMVAVVIYDVFTRYVLRSSSVAVQEMEWHIFSLIFLIGGAYTLKEEGHVRVDIFYSRFSARGKAWIDLVGGVVFLVPFCLLVIWTSHQFVAMSWMTREMSPDPGGLPGRYLLKAAIPAGFVLILVQGIAQTLRALLTVLGHPLAGPAPTGGEVDHA